MPKLFPFEKFNFRWRKCEMVLSLEKHLNCTISFIMVKRWSATMNDARKAHCEFAYHIFSMTNLHSESASRQFQFLNI